jgi:hypothetical protein
VALTWQLRGFLQFVHHVHCAATVAGASKKPLLPTPPMQSYCKLQ